MSSGPVHQGTFSVQFNSEKTYNRFGVEWAKCNTYLEVRGHIEKPQPEGSKWTYKVDYKLGCKCDNVLKNFDLAYAGAFNSSQLAAPNSELGPYSLDGSPLQILKGRDYTAELQQCMLPRMSVTESDGNDLSRPLSLFHTQAADRRLLAGHRANNGSLTTDADYDQKPWNLLYGALVNSLGASPQTFQMVYPYTTWTWPTQQVGYMSSAQYDFCSTAPQWSAIGAYVSSADRVNLAYGAFLDVISPATEDPVLRKKIQDAYDRLTNANNDYTIKESQASRIYAEKVKDNSPSYSDWLGSVQGRGYGAQIKAAWEIVEQAQKNLTALVGQANTPGLSEAMRQLDNKDFYSRLSDQGLSNFPPVPNWQVADNPSAWVSRIKAGDGPGGATMGFTNRDSSYDFSRTWAGGSASVTRLFWEVKVGGSWERVEAFESDKELEVSVEFQALELIPINASDWFNSVFVRQHAGGPFVHGYSADGKGNTQAVFGDKGFFNLMKTGMYVAYKPNFTVRVSQSSFQSFREKFKAATSFRIGPISFEAEGGSERAGWTASEKGCSFTGTSTSESPVIVGISITRLPNQNDDQALLLAEQQLGNIYTFSDGGGDVLARNVPPNAVDEIGGYWKPSRS